MSNAANSVSIDQAAGPTLARRQRRSAELRHRLFGEKGFAETTVEDITEAADVDKGTFFNYFPTKDHILLTFFEKDLFYCKEIARLMAEERKSSSPEDYFYFGRTHEQDEILLLRQRRGIRREILAAA